MGTKGKKNIPITARVESGLFNQKKGVKEPLLNVGPAGVHGNNQTRDIPSPSKLRGYSMKKKTESPIKQVNTNVITLGEDTPAVAGTPATNKKSLRQAYDDALTLNYRKADETFESYSARAMKDPLYGTSGTNATPGSDAIEGVDEVDSIPLQTKDNLDAMSPWRVRQQSRAIKKSGKDVRQAQNKLDATNRKLKKLKDAGITSGRKFDRLKSKFTENTNELDAFNKNMAARTRQVEMSSDPLGKNRTFKSTERNLEKGDLTIEQQDARNKKEIEANRIKAAAAVDKKSSPNFFKSKSPMKKNYFK
jgi:hypothetical protein